MDRFHGNTAGQLATTVKTPLTDGARFTVTAKDVGSEAVRPGLMAELETERAVLLSAAKIALAHIRKGDVGIGAPYELLLSAAVALAEAPK